MHKNKIIDPRIEKNGPTNNSLETLIRDDAIRLLIIAPTLKKNTIEPARNRLEFKSSKSQTDDHTIIIPIEAVWNIFIAPYKKVFGVGKENLGSLFGTSYFFSRP